MSITQKNINTFCRMCLTKLEESGECKFHVHKTRNLSKWISLLNVCEMKKNDKYPKFLCQLCYDKLESLNDFRLMSIRSMEILDNIMQSPTYDSENEVIEGAKKLRTTKTDDADENTVFFQRVYTVDREDGDARLNMLENGLTKVNNRKQNLSESSKKLEVQSSCLHSEDENKTDTDSDEDSKSEEFQENDDFDADTEDYEEKSRHDRKKIRSCSQVNERKTQVFKCEKCPKRCFSKANIDAHMRTHEGLKPYPCSLCHKSYNKSSHLNVHIKDSHTGHTEEFPCEAEGCNKKFRRIQSYRVHYRLKHAQDKPSPKIYVCEDCGKTFKNTTTLKEHRYKHTNEEEYPYQCEHCSKRFVSQRTYREHLMRHAGIKNFVCTYCGMKKTTKSELRIHINYHTKEKQWPCPLCPSVFNSSANLGLHDRVVHKGIRRYICRFCEQSFGKAETLKHHEMRHTGEKPHECDICKKRFIQVVALRAHLKTHKNLKEDSDSMTRGVRSDSIPAQA